MRYKKLIGVGYYLLIIDYNCQFWCWLFMFFNGNKLESYRSSMELGNVFRSWEANRDFYRGKEFETLSLFKRNLKWANIYVNCHICTENRKFWIGNQKQLQYIFLSCHHLNLLIIDLLFVIKNLTSWYIFIILPSRQQFWEYGHFN